MPCSPEQKAANRMNSLKSTGPSTEAGKAASRCNALKHGLSGQGVVCLEQDAAEVDRRSAALARQLKPANELSRGLVQRVAVLSVRLERCAAHELIAMSVNARQAASDYDCQVLAEVEDLVDALPERPSLVVRQLKGSAEGVARLVEAWAEIKPDLEAGRWKPEHGVRMAHLKGFRADDCQALALVDDTSALQGEYGEASEAARGRLMAVIEAEVGRLNELYYTFDHEAGERARREFIAYARLAPTPETILARRYEATAEREMFRVIREARLVDMAPTLADQMGVEPSADPDANHHQETPSGGLASFFRLDEPAAVPAEFLANTDTMTMAEGLSSEFLPGGSPNNGIDGENGEFVTTQHTP